MTNLYAVAGHALIHIVTANIDLDRSTSAAGSLSDDCVYAATVHVATDCPIDVSRWAFVHSAHGATAWRSCASTD